jgi:protein phosphatase
MALNKLALRPIKAAAYSDIGRRPNNEDAASYSLEKSIIAGREMYRFIGVVADGVGGRAKGEVASEIAVKHIKSYIQDQLATSNGEFSNPANIIITAYSIANNKIIELSQSNPEFIGMATTATTVVVQERSDSVELWVGHVGDSRAYMLMLTRKKIILLTRDHTLIQEMIEKNQITPEEAMYHPYRSFITKALGSSDWIPDFTIHRYTEPFLILICSDGLIHKLSMDEIYSNIIMKYNRNVGYTNILKSLCDKALERGEKDNITAILAGPFQLPIV